MLVERRNVRQIAGEGFRRWFSDEYFDLIVWYDGEAQADGELSEAVVKRFRSNSPMEGLSIQNLVCTKLPNTGNLAAGTVPAGQ